MALDNFRVQLTRGPSAALDAYTGNDGEVVFDTEKKTLRVCDGVNAGGEEISAGSQAITIDVTSYTNGTFVLPAGVTAVKEYSDSSLRITHNQGKNPVGWFGLAKNSSPMTGIVPTNTTNMQVIDANTVIITNVSSLEKFEISLSF